MNGISHNSEMLEDLSELFKVMGDYTRLRICFLLFERELCVTDIAEMLEMNQSAVSHQLRTLSQSKLIRKRRNGKQIIYTLADDHVRLIVNQGIDHIIEL